MERLSTIKLFMLVQSVGIACSVITGVINNAQLIRHERMWQEAREYGKLAGLPTSSCSPAQEHIISLMRQVKEGLVNQ